MGSVVGDVLQVQHGHWAENVHFRLLLFLPVRLAFASLPFPWLSETSEGGREGTKISFQNLDLNLVLLQHTYDISISKLYIHTYCNRGCAIYEIATFPMKYKGGIKR